MGEKAAIYSLSPVRRLLRLLNAERRDIGYIYFYAILTGLISLSLPLGIQAIINYVQTAQVSTSWFVLVVVVTGGVALQSILQIMQLSISETIQQRLFTNSAFEFAYRIPRLDFDHSHGHYPPELVNRFFDTISLQKGISKIVLDLSGATLQIVFGLILLSFYHGFFVVFGIFLIVVLALVIRYTSPYGIKTSIIESKYKYAVAHWLEEMARSIELFKLAGNPRYALSRTDLLTQNYLKARKQHFRILVSKYIFLIGFKVLIIAALLVLGSLLVINGQMNVGQFVAVEIVIILLLNSVEKLILSIETVYDVLTSVDKIGFVTDIPLEQDGGEPIDSRSSGLSVDVKDLHYTYPGSNQPTVIAPEFRAEAGSKIFIQGSDQVGKTAFLRLLAGFFREYQGYMAFDGLPLPNVNLHAFRKQIGGFGDVRDVFDGSIKDNITLGEDGIGVDKLMEVIRLVGLSGFVESHPEGIEYRITSEPEKVPEVILRKIVLARALAKPVRLLLLDEPVKGFSPADQARVMDHILKKLSGTTVIITTEQETPRTGFTHGYQLEAGLLAPLKGGN